MEEQKRKYVCKICSKSLSCRQSLYRHKKSCVLKSSPVKVRVLRKLDDTKKSISPLLSIHKCDKCSKVYRMCLMCTIDEA